MAASRALVVAIVATVLLILSVTGDVTMRRTYALDVQTAAGWKTIAVSDPATDTNRIAVAPYGPCGYNVLVNGTTLQMRVTMENGYFWSTTKHYTVDVYGTNVAEGDITASARGHGESAFTVDSTTAVPNAPPAPADAKASGCGNATSVPVNVLVDDRSLYGTIGVSA